MEALRASRDVIQAEIDRLATGFGPLEQTADNWTAHLGFSLNRDVSRWRLAMTGRLVEAWLADQAF